MMAGCHTQIDKPNEDGNGEVTSVTILALGENSSTVFVVWLSL